MTVYMPACLLGLTFCLFLWGHVDIGFDLRESDAGHKSTPTCLLCRGAGHSHPQCHRGEGGSPSAGRGNGVQWEPGVYICDYEDAHFVYTLSAFISTALFDKCAFSHRCGPCPHIQHTTLQRGISFCLMPVAYFLGSFGLRNKHILMKPRPSMILEACQPEVGLLCLAWILVFWCVWYM